MDKHCAYQDDILLNIKLFRTIDDMAHNFIVKIFFILFNQI